METLHEMQIFLRVVQAGSLSAAARQLDCSPASISRYISRLEDALRVRLLNRSSRRTSLTEVGEIYLRSVERILADIGDTHDAIAEMVKVPRGLLHVHSRVTIGNHYIVPALPEFLTRYPDVQVSLTLSDQRIDLVDQRVDVSVHSGSLGDSALIVRKLASTSRIVCAAPGYLEEHDTPKHPRDLLRHRCLTYRYDLHDVSSSTWRYRGADCEGEIKLRSYLQSNSGVALREMALAEVGIGLLPIWLISEDLRSRRLVRFLKNYEVGIAQLPFKNTVYAVYQPTRHMSPKVRAFIDFLSEVFRRSEASGWPAVEAVAAE